MTTKRALPLALVAAFIVLCLLLLVGIWATQLRSGPPTTASNPVALGPLGSDQQDIGTLRFLGGIALSTRASTLGGISALEWQHGQLFGVQDDGYWLSIIPAEQDGRLTGIESIQSGRLQDLEGTPLSGKTDSDAESLTSDGAGGWLVGFERDHRIWRYAALDRKAARSGIDTSALTGQTKANSGLETLAMQADGSLLLCGEYEPVEGPNCGMLKSGALDLFALTAPPPVDSHGGVPTDAACAADGTCYILFRSYDPVRGNTAAIIARAADGAVTTVAVLLPPLTLDNFEGLALREESGRRFLYVASDDNFSAKQRSLLMKFEVMP